MSPRTVEGTRAMRLARFGAAALLLVLVGCATPNDNDTRSATAGMPNLSQDLASQEWLLNQADSSVKTHVSDPVTLLFDGHTVSGTGPCNTYRGHVSIDNDANTIHITDLAQTKLACAPNVMEAEQEYFAALARVRDVDLSGGYTEQKLVLDNDAGDRLSYNAIDVNQLLTHAWNVVSVSRDDGIHSALAGTKPTITFDGRHVTLDSGCNTGSGTYRLDGTGLHVNTLGGTLKLCTDPAGIMEQESALMHALDSAARVQVTPDALTIFDDADRVLIVANR